MSVLRIGLVAATVAVALGLAACQKEEAPAKPTEAPLVAPVGGDDAAWRQYLGKVAMQHAGTGPKALKPFVIYMPEGAEAQRYIDQVQEYVTRGMDVGTMLMFGSPDSAQTLNVIQTVFASAKPIQIERLARNGLTIVYVGSAEAGEQVRAIVEPTGIVYRFHEAK